MTHVIILISSMLAYGGLCYYLGYRNERQKTDIKTLKGQKEITKRAKEIEQYVDGLSPDAVWSELESGGWVR